MCSVWVPGHFDLIPILIFLFFFCFFQIKEYERLQSFDDRLARAREIYDNFIMKELLSCSHVCSLHQKKKKFFSFDEILNDDIYLRFLSRRITFTHKISNLTCLWVELSNLEARFIDGFTVFELLDNGWIYPLFFPWKFKFFFKVTFNALY